MIVAFCLYKYFPFGGLQRDFMRIASTVAARATMFGYIHSRGKAIARKHLSLFAYRLNPILTMDVMQNIMPGFKTI